MGTIKLRSCVSLLAICAAASALSVSGSAFAQQPAPTDQVKEIARQRYGDGVKAYDAGRFEDARLAFEQAYQLTQVPAVLYNLGLAELKAGKTVAGGNHLLQFLREAKDATDDKKTAANAAIEDAKKKACLVTITVDAPGADVSVDGTLVGKSPLPDPVFVELGPRTLLASVSGKTGMTKIDAKKGTASAAIVTGATATGPATGPTGPGTGPTGPGTGPTGPGTGPTGPGTGPTGPGTGPTGPGTGPGTGPTGPGIGIGTPPPGGGDTAPQGREDFFHWYARKPLAWVGTGVFAVGLGLGIGFSAAAAGTKSDSESIAQQIRDKAAADGLSGAPCGPEDSSGGADVYPSACNKLRDALSAHNTNTTVAVVGWVTAGVAAAGTVTYIMVDWFANDAPADDRAQPPHAQVLPLVGPGYVGVTGSF
jgi:hypothetical protein